MFGLGKGTSECERLSGGTATAELAVLVATHVVWGGRRHSRAVTPEAAGSSPVDPANYPSQVTR